MAFPYRDLWACGLSGGTQEVGSTAFNVGQKWTLVTVPLDVENPGHTALRAEIYMGTTNANLDADGANLTAVTTPVPPPPSPVPTPAPEKSGSITLNYSWTWSSGNLSVVGSAPPNAKVTSLYLSGLPTGGEISIDQITLTHAGWTDTIFSAYTDGRVVYPTAQLPETVPFVGQLVSGAWTAIPRVLARDSSSTLQVSVVINWNAP